VNPLAITAATATTALGLGIDALGDALKAGRSGLAPNDFTATATGVGLDTWIGRVGAVDNAALPAAWRTLDSRNNRLAWLALRQDGFVASVRDTIARVGATRVALLVGTSTSTIEVTERAYRERPACGGVPPVLAHAGLHHLHATTAFVADALGIEGPAHTVSTACSSSAKVFAQAMRMIDIGLVDAAVVGGVDSLASSTLFGFHALGLVSTEPCRPFDRRRDGISVGEAAGFAIVERVDARRHDRVPLLVGYGESSDAHHMSAPHPDGAGARRAIDDALARADLRSDAVDYINLHGTATSKNDAVEAAVISAMFPDRLRASSTKGSTGHALGAAGVIESLVCLVAMRDAFAPGTAGCADRDPVCGPQIRVDATAGPVGIALSNAFAFGGNNCVLAFARDLDTWHGARRRDAR
jgi:3-oxoacyl-[acyl-carrier-protein] synthase I